MSATGLSGSAVTEFSDWRRLGVRGVALQGGLETRFSISSLAQSPAGPQGEPLMADRVRFPELVLVISLVQLPESVAAISRVQPQEPAFSLARFPEWAAVISPGLLPGPV